MTRHVNIGARRVHLTPTLWLKPHRPPQSHISSTESRALFVARFCSARTRMLTQIPKGRRNKILHLSLFPLPTSAARGGQEDGQERSSTADSPRGRASSPRSRCPKRRWGRRRRAARAPGEEDGAKPTRRAWVPRSAQMASSFEGAIIGLALVSCCLPTALKSKTHSWRSE